MIDDVLLLLQLLLTFEIVSLPNFVTVPIILSPYDIGDIVHFSSPDHPDNPNGSIGWIIQRVTLFETVGTWVPTLERASFNNGSLASSQIINWRRSPNARMNVQLNFPIETKYEQLEIFKSAIEEYIRIRYVWLCVCVCVRVCFCVITSSVSQ